MGRLAREEPDSFESLRKHFIEYEIIKADSSKSKLLPGLQFQIDIKRKSSGSAMGACIIISRMMMDSFHKVFQPTLNSFVNNEKINDKRSRKNNIVELFEK